MFLVKGTAEAKAQGSERVWLLWEMKQNSTWLVYRARGRRRDDTGQRGRPDPTQTLEGGA